MSYKNSLQQILLCTQKLI